MKSPLTRKLNREADGPLSASIGHCGGDSTSTAAVLRWGMPKPPRRPRAITCAPETPDATLRSGVVVPRRDKRQADLFATAYIPPCKPVLSDSVPSSDLWQYEIKHDGYRVPAHVNAGHVRIFTKSGLDWSERMPAIRAAPKP